MEKKRKLMAFVFGNEIIIDWTVLLVETQRYWDILSPHCKFSFYSFLHDCRCFELCLKQN